jgi:hypothetical protein
MWTDGKEHLILDAIHDIIGHARRTLVLSTFSLRGLTESPQILVEPVADAIRRGVHVALLTRPRNNLAGHRRDAQSLAKLGVTVLGDTQNHAKCAIADGNVGAVFSANFDTEHGLISGVEMGARLDGSSALRDVCAFFTHLVENADCAFAARPQQRDMNEMLYGRWHKPWPFSGELAVVADDRSWNAFGLVVECGPVLYSCRAPGYMSIYAAGGRWQLQPMDGEARYMMSLVEPPSDRGTGDTLQLLDEWFAKSGGDEEERGFCTAVICRTAA